MVNPIRGGILFIADWRQFPEVQELAFHISLNLKESLTLIPLAFLIGSLQDCKNGNKGPSRAEALKMDSKLQVGNWQHDHMAAPERLRNILLALVDVFGKRMKTMTQTHTVQFVHRFNEDGTIDSICRDCFVTVATDISTSHLELEERKHKCDLSLIDRYKNPRHSENIS